MPDLRELGGEGGVTTALGFLVFPAIVAILGVICVGQWMRRNWLTHQPAYQLEKWREFLEREWPAPPPEIEDWDAFIEGHLRAANDPLANTARIMREVYSEKWRQDARIEQDRARRARHAELIKHAAGAYHDPMYGRKIPRRKD